MRKRRSTRDWNARKVTLWCIDAHGMYFMSHQGGGTRDIFHTRIYLGYISPGRRHAGYTQAWKKLIFWPPFHLRWSPVSMSNNSQLSTKLSKTKKENMFPALTCVGTSTYLKPRLEWAQKCWIWFCLCVTIVAYQRHSRPLQYLRAD